MAEIAFHYLVGSSLLHRLDARHKLLSLIALCAGVLGSAWGWLPAFTVLLGAGIRTARIPALAMFRELSFILILIAVVFFATVIGAVGASDGASLESTLAAAAEYSWRLVLVMTAASLLVATTSLRELRLGVARLLRRVPLVDAAAVSAMIALTVGFIPLIADQAGALRRASAARCIASAGSPIRRIKYLGLPLLVRTLRRVDAVSRALESRGFDGTNVPSPRRPAARDTLFLTAAVLLAVGSLITR